MERWSREKIWAWYNAHPWLCGCNYFPADTLNMLDFWQALDFEHHMETARREFETARDIGFNTVRIFLSFEVWQVDAEGLKQRLDRFLALAAEYGISVMVTLGNDCHCPKEQYRAPVVGVRPEVAWGYHGGVAATPFSGTTRVGYNPMVDDPAALEASYAYVRDVVSAFRDDPRILIWDLWNEPGNSHRDSMSLPCMRRFFAIAREVGASQPLTACTWSIDCGKEPKFENLKEIEREALELSDIISFHYYGRFSHLVEAIALLKTLGRPILNTEWLHRLFGNKVETILPTFWLENIGSYNWGFFAGKSQTYEPWEGLRKRTDLDFSVWQHDLFRENGRPYDPREIDTIRYFAKKGRAPRA